MGLYMKGILPMQWGCTGKDLLYAENENCPLYSQAGRIKTVQREYTRVRDITDRTRPERPATARHGSARHGKPVSPKNTAARLWQSATATARHGTETAQPETPRTRAAPIKRTRQESKREHKQIKKQQLVYDYLLRYTPPLYKHKLCSGDSPIPPISFPKFTLPLYERLGGSSNGSWQVWRRPTPAPPTPEVVDTWRAI